jgi:hypothetical protein
MQCVWEAQMNNPRDFGRPPLDGAPTVAAPAAQAWGQQAPYGDPAGYRPYVQQQRDVVYAQQSPAQQVVIPLAPAAPPVPPPSQSVATARPAPRSSPRQQATVPRARRPVPSVVSPAPLAPAPNSPAAEPIPVPEQKQDPEPQQKQDPEPQQKQDPPDKFNPGDPQNPTPDDLLCHPNPPGCTGHQKAPAQPQQPAP